MIIKVEFNIPLADRYEAEGIAKEIIENGVDMLSSDKPNIKEYVEYSIM